MEQTTQEPTGRYRWLEFKPRRKRDGLHDSGYRFIQLRGAREKNGEIVYDDLHQWSDHVLLLGPTNIDVEPDGTIRLMLWSDGEWDCKDARSGHFSSSATFNPSNWERAVSLLRTYSEIESPR